MSAPKNDHPPYIVALFSLFLATLYLCFYFMLSIKPSSVSVWGIRLA